MEAAVSCVATALFGIDFFFWQAILPSVTEERDHSHSVISFFPAQVLVCRLSGGLGAQLISFSFCLSQFLMSLVSFFSDSRLSFVCRCWCDGSLVASGSSFPARSLSQFLVSLASFASGFLLSCAGAVLSALWWPQKKNGGGRLLCRHRPICL